MRNGILFFFFTTLILTSHGQNSFRVTYDIYYKNGPIAKSELKQPLKCRLVYNDTMGYSYFFSKKDPYQNNKYYGRQFLHQSIFYNVKENMWYEELYLKNSWGKFRVSDTMNIPGCTYLPGEKYILGYKCNLALGIDSVYDDSTYVWYTTEVKNQLGPSNFTNFPGLVLEMYWVKLGYRVVAIKIEEGEYEIVMPVMRLQIPRKEFLKKQEEKNKL